MGGEEVGIGDQDPKKELMQCLLQGKLVVHTILGLSWGQVPPEVGYFKSPSILRVYYVPTIFYC